MFIDEQKPPWLFRRHMIKTKRGHVAYSNDCCVFWLISLAIIAEIVWLIVAK